MDDRTFPTLPNNMGLLLRAVEAQVEFDPGYFEDPRCPYSADTKRYLQKMVQPLIRGRDDAVTKTFKAGQTPEDEADSLIGEIRSALNSMRSLQNDMEGNTVEVTDKLTFLKNYGALMEKFLSLQEKAYGVKQMYEFQRIVVEVMEQLLDKDGRLEFKNRLKKINVETSSTTGATEAVSDNVPSAEAA